MPLAIADTGAQAIGQGLQQFGAGITNIGIAVKRAQEKRQDIADMTERINVTSLMNASGRNIQTKIETEPDYTKWDGFREEEFKTLQSSISGNNLMSDKEKSLSMARLEAWNIEKSSQLNLQQAQTIVDTGQKTILAGLEMAYSTGSKSDQATVEDAWNLMWPELFPNKVLAKEAHDNAVARGKKQFNDANVKLWRNHASADPELTKSVLEDERTDRKEGKGVINEEALSNEDITDIISHANSVITMKNANARRGRSELEQKTYRDMISEKLNRTLTPGLLEQNKDNMSAENYGTLTTYLLNMDKQERRIQEKADGLTGPNREVYLRIQDGGITTPEQIDRYVESGDLDAKDAATRKRELTKFQELRTAKLEAKSDLNNLLSDLERGFIDEEQFNQELIESSTIDPETGLPLITNDEHGFFVNKVARAIEGSQSAIVTKYRRRLINQVVTYATDDSWGAILAELKSKGLTEAIKTETNKRQSQFLWVDQFEDKLRDLIYIKAKEGKELFGRDLEIEARRMFNDYRNASFEHIRETYGTEAIKKEQPTVTELRRIGTKEAYEEGKKLGYWK